MKWCTYTEIKTDIIVFNPVHSVFFMNDAILLVYMKRLLGIQVEFLLLYMYILYERFSHW